MIERIIIEKILLLSPYFKTREASMTSTKGSGVGKRHRGSGSSKNDNQYNHEVLKTLRITLLNNNI